VIIVSGNDNNQTDSLFEGGGTNVRESLLLAVTKGFARALKYEMPPKIDAVHGLKAVMSDSIKRSLDSFGLRSGLDEQIPYEWLKKYTDLEYSPKVQEWIINGTKTERSTGKSVPRGYTIPDFTKKVQGFFARRKYDVALFDQAGQPVVVVECEFLKHNWQFLEDFVKLLFIVSPIKIFIHRRHNARGGDMNAPNKEPVVEVFREFMSCYTDHAVGEEYIIIQAMDYNSEIGHTIGHHFIVPNAGRLYRDQIVFTEMPGSPCAWPRHH
jgi:hypothetical protein